GIAARRLVGSDAPDFDHPAVGVVADQHPRRVGAVVTGLADLVQATGAGLAIQAQVVLPTPAGALFEHPEIIAFRILRPGQRVMGAAAHRAAVDVCGSRVVEIRMAAIVCMEADNASDLVERPDQLDALLETGDPAVGTNAGEAAQAVVGPDQAK